MNSVSKRCYATRFRVISAVLLFYVVGFCCTIVFYVDPLLVSTPTIEGDGTQTPNNKEAKVFEEGSTSQKGPRGGVGVSVVVDRRDDSVATHREPNQGSVSSGRTRPIDDAPERDPFFLDDARFKVGSREETIVVDFSELFRETGRRSSNTTTTIRPLLLSAYLEPPTEWWVPGTATDKNPFGDLISPPPLRTQTPSDLKRFDYPDVRSCADVPKRWPVIRGLERDANGELVFQNVNRKEPLLDPLSEAHVCPVDADPFLPWIHDVFPNAAGDRVHFIAQNKRRCNMGSNFKIEIERLEPQVAILQGVRVAEVVDPADVPSELWDDDGATPSTEKRWRLTNTDAEDEGERKLTRFVCRFKAIAPSGTVRALGETLSEFPIDYELVNSRKNGGGHPMLTKEGRDKGTFWLSSFQFDCPVPDDVPGLREAIQTGAHVTDDNVSLVYVDVVPIRTAPRTGRGRDQRLFNGESVLPRIDASGRWQNIPVCVPPRPKGIASANEKTTDVQVRERDELADDENNQLADNDRNKTHYLVGCLWASAVYNTRNNGVQVADTLERLSEWLEFQFLVGFDHVYVYDNTGAHAEASNGTANVNDLSSVTNRFSPERVTRVEWPFRVCNNNFPQNENPGERSSQYAAETSCLKRYGPHTEWIASFDADEYFVPMGMYESLKDLLSDVDKKGTRILSFRSAKSLMNVEHTSPYIDGKNCGAMLNASTCVQKSPNSTFLKTYGLDPVGIPRPRNKYERAKKQIYRPDYVLSHFVHYSTVTKGLIDPETRSRSHKDARVVERFVDEEHEAYMVHARTVRPDGTENWRMRCKFGFKPNRWGTDKCPVGVAFPYDAKAPGDAEATRNANDYAYNAFANKRLETYWEPRLQKAMDERRAREHNMS